MAKSVLTDPSQDFPRWYQDVVAKAGLAENGAARGTMIIRPWGYAIWERVQAALDERIKATGHDNVYFPLFIPMSYFEREAEHVEGFSPELAVVTHGGGSELAEPLAIRPTSETVIGEAMSRWVQSYRDLPLLLNQWSNVVRWELRPRLFLRTSEFLWQEGHTAHATADDAVAETLRMLVEAYDDVMARVLAIPTLRGRKTEREKFAGAHTTYTLESLMRDGKALQMGTSHYMAQNFAKAFDITFSDETGGRQQAYTTSWGMSTRVIGGMIMTHGDERGLRLPPAIAPVQVVVLAIKDEAVEACRTLVAELEAAGVRTRLDDATGTSFGRRAVEWELKGVPVRLEIGPRDLDAGQATLVRRDVEGKQALRLNEVRATVPGLLDEVQRGLFDDAVTFRDGHTRVASQQQEVDGAGFWTLPWGELGVDGEAALAQRGYSVRCLLRADGGLPDPGQSDELVAWVARAY